MHGYDLLAVITISFENGKHLKAPTSTQKVRLCAQVPVYIKCNTFNMIFNLQFSK